MHQMPKELLLTQIENGLVLLALGMGVVFIFLLMLVYSTKLLSKLVGKFSPQAAIPAAKAPFEPVGQVMEGPGPEIAAAIAAAIAKSKR